MSDQLAHKGTIIIVLYSKVGLFLYQHLGGISVRPACRAIAEGREQLQELVEEKDDIINRQADHIKRLTKALMGGW